MKEKEVLSPKTLSAAAGADHRPRSDRGHGLSDPLIPIGHPLLRRTDQEVEVIERICTFFSRRLLDFGEIAPLLRIRNISKEITLWTSLTFRAAFFRSIATCNSISPR
jgi:hypothetical protein